MSVELDREHPVFEGVVPVRVEGNAGNGHRHETESRSTLLTLRIVRGVKKSSQDSRVSVLHMEVTHDEDFYFLYTMQVSEEEYHELKSEQSLLVDFAGFPPQFVELLQACQRGQIGELNAGKFIAVLDLANLPIFKIVEANQFKQLTHLALRFQPGTDATVKAYLASRLRHAQKEANERAVLIENLKKQAELRDDALEKTKDEVSQLKSELNKVTEKLNNEHAETLARQKEESLRLLSQTQNAASEQARKQQETADRRITELETKLSALQTEHRKLYEAKAASDAELQQMRVKNASLEKFSEDGTSELDKLRKGNRELQAAVYDLEKKVSEQQLTLAAVKQQVEDKEDLLNKTSAMLEQAQERRSAVEDKMNHYKSSSAKLQRKLELSIKEINKGNGVIETLQAELRQAKEKMRTKNIVIRQQERVLEDTRTTLEDEQTATERAKEQLEKEKAVSAELRAALQASKDRLEECNKMLESNQNVIAFLNKEINEAQLGPGARLSSTSHPSPTGPFDYRFSSSPGGTYGISPSPSPELLGNMHTTVPRTPTYQERSPYLTPMHHKEHQYSAPSKANEAAGSTTYMYSTSSPRHYDEPRRSSLDVDISTGLHGMGGAHYTNRAQRSEGFASTPSMTKNDLQAASYAPSEPILAPQPTAPSRSSPQTNLQGSENSNMSDFMGTSPTVQVQ